VPSRRSILRSLVMLALVLTWSTPVLAQAYPQRNIKIIVPQPPGGGFDTVARVLADRLSPLLGQPVGVENRPGAGTLIGTEAAAKASPDGYTLLLGAAITYASAGRGSGQHVAMAVAAQLAGVKLTHVAYRGAQAAYQDVLGGRVDLFFFDISSTARAQVDAGSVRPLAVSSNDRHPMHPDVPSVTETGVAALDMESWFGLFGSAGVPSLIGATARRVCQGASRSGGGRAVRQNRRAHAQPVASRDRNPDQA
jgi:tripartite-type tricarboxylate transporter receptor subunit TctC